MNGHYDAVVVGGGAGGTYAAWRLLTGAVGAGSPLAPAPSDRRIALIELSDRIGGRLESLVPPGMQNLRAEFGGMGFTSNDAYVTALAKLFSLDVGPFPEGDDNNILYVRGTRFTAAQAKDQTVVPYRLAADEWAHAPGGLVPYAIEKVFPNSLTWTYEQWDAATQKPYAGRNLNDMGFWNFLLTQMSNEALEYTRDAFGHFFEVANWNARQALPWFMGDGAATYSTLVDGYDELPKAMQAAFAQAGGDTFMSTQVASVQPTTGTDGLTIVSSAGETCTAGAVVLAMPRRSLELIACGVLEQPAIATLVGSVTGQQVMKLFCCYDSPWWAAAPLSITNGASGTDLPLGNVWYFGPDSTTNDASLLLASYNDTLSTTYWEGVSTGERFAGNDDAGNLDPHWAAQTPSALMVDLAQQQLAEMHGVTVPEPYSAAWMDWSADPFGGAFYTWNVGVDADAVAQSILQPDPSCPLYVCGEAYSHDQGWVEGALVTAEQVVERLGVEPPGWD